MSPNTTEDFCHLCMSPTEEEEHTPSVCHPQTTLTDTCHRQKRRAGDGGGCSVLTSLYTRPVYPPDPRYAVQQTLFSVSSNMLVCVQYLSKRTCAPHCYPRFCFPVQTAWLYFPRKVQNSGLWSCSATHMYCKRNQL